MPKKDIRNESPLAWDQYNGKSVDEALPSIYKQACSASTRFAEWYWNSIKTKRRTSLGVRFVSLLFLIVGTVSPILAGLPSDPNIRLSFTQLAVCSLALGGLLQVADRIFGWSSGWIRYITTATAMENLAFKFQLDWAAFVLEKGGAVTDTDIKPLFDLAAQLQDSLMKLQSEETDKWQAEFSTGAALLGDLIKSQRESGEKAVEAASAAVAAQKALADAASLANAPGALEVTLVHKADPVPVLISIDGDPPERFIGKSWTRTKLAPGVRTLSVASETTPPVLVNKVVEIPSGGIQKTEVKLT